MEEKWYEVIFAPKGSTKCIRRETSGENPEDAKNEIRKEWKVNFIQEVNEISGPSGLEEIVDLLVELSDLNVLAYLDRLEKIGY